MPKKSKRRALSAQFKFRIALQAIIGVESINEIAAHENVHPTQVSTWKKELEDGGSDLFERKNARCKEREDAEAHTASVERALGRTIVERDFLVKSASTNPTPNRKPQPKAELSF